MKNQYKAWILVICLLVPSVASAQSIESLKTLIGELIVKISSLQTAAVSQSLSLSAASSTAKATLYGTPTLGTMLDSQSGKQLLVGTFSVTITTGAKEVRLLGTSAWIDVVSTVVGQKTPEDNILTIVPDIRGRNFISSYGDAYGRKIYIVPANTTVKFKVTSSYKIEQMFAGSYTESLRELYAIDPVDSTGINVQSITIPANTTKPFTVVGETSPYINSLTPNPVLTGNTLVIRGVRMPTRTLIILGGKEYTGALNGSGQINFTIPTSVVPGKYPLQLRAVGANTPKSNIVYVEIGSRTSPLLPDLSIVDTQIAYPIQNDNRATVSFVVKNTGSSSASSASSSLSYLMSDRPSEIVTNTSNTCTASTILLPGDSCIASYKLKYGLSGNHTILINLDPGNKVIESNENNNQGRADFITTPPLPPGFSVSITSPTYQSSYTTSDTIPVSYKVGNTSKPLVIELEHYLATLSTPRTVARATVTAPLVGDNIFAFKMEQFQTVSYIPSGHYRIVILDEAGVAKAGSDGFPVTSLQSYININNPLGSGILYSGTTTKVDFTTNIPVNSGYKVDLLSKTDLSVVAPLGSGVTQMTGGTILQTYQFMLPSSIRSGSYYVRIACTTCNKPVESTSSSYRVIYLPPPLPEF